MRKIKKNNRKTLREHRLSRRPAGRKMTLGIAQPFRYGTGCMPSVMDGTEHVLSVDDKTAVPDKCSWRDAMPPVRNQGMSSTCVCQSLTGVLDFYHNEKAGTPNKCNGFSIDELYSIRADKTAQGMTFKEALHYLRHHGLGDERILSYSKVNSVLAARYAIMMFGPIVAGFPVYSGSNPQFWRKRGFFQGGHAVTIVGYTPKGFIIRNSWGTSWGDRGHVLLPYDEFDDCCFEAWTVTI